MKLIKIVGWAAAGLAALTACFAILALGYRAHIQSENEERAEIQSPDGIRQEKYVRIGGIDQWVTIRGQDRKNPVLLFLHGGPGVPLYPVAYNILQPLEKNFTVVYWDQRGAGRTYARNPRMPASVLTLARLEADTVELIEFLRKDLGQEKIGLVAASAGSGFGIRVAKHRPDLLYAYVGVGQLLGIDEGDELLYDFVMQRALETKNQQALNELRAVGPPPFKDIEESTVARRWLTEFSPSSEREFNGTWNLLSAMLTAPGYSLGEIRDIISGSEFSLAALYDEYRTADARKLGRDFQVPLIFIQGDQDYLTPTKLVEQYAAWVHAPYKRVLVISDGGHSASVALPGQFIPMLDRVVRPLGLSSLQK
jgi:pimeloyl-ACP methyl ester carboxylesterase